MQRLHSVSVIWLLLTLTLAGCQTMDSGAISAALPASIPCAGLSPIYWSKQDTRKTQEQVTEFNAAYKAACMAQ